MRLADAKLETSEWMSVVLAWQPEDGSQPSTTVTALAPHCMAAASQHAPRQHRRIFQRSTAPSVVVFNYHSFRYAASPQRRCLYAPPKTMQPSPSSPAAAGAPPKYAATNMASMRAVGAGLS